MYVNIHSIAVVYTYVVDTYVLLSKQKNNFRGKHLQNFVRNVVNNKMKSDFISFQYINQTYVKIKIIFILTYSLLQNN